MRIGIASLRERWTPRFLGVSLVLLLLSLPAPAAKVERVDVIGANRIDEGMIRSLVPIRAGDEADDKKLSDALKVLHASKYFEDIKLEMKGSALVIRVREAPLIGEVAYEGMEAIKEDQLKDKLFVKPRTLFSPAAVQKDIDALKMGYKTLGYFRAQIDAKTIDRANGTKDVVFEINEGERAFINEIRFHGVEAFSESKLYDALMSKEWRWWAFMETMDVFHEERTLYDAELIRQLYINNGFLDVEVVSFTAKMDAGGEGFYIDFYIREGKRYKVSSVSIENTIKDLETDGLEDEILLSVGRWYSDPLAKRTASIMTTKIGEKGFAFVNVEIDRRPNQATGEVAVVFKIVEGRKAAVNNISVRANTRTYDSIIRRNLDFDEQGAMSPSLFQSSEQKLMGLGYFEKVAIVPRPVPGVGDKVDVDVVVAEKSTGQFTFGAGWSSINNAFIEAGIQENNFGGRGQVLGFNAAFSQFQNNFTANFTEPYLFGRDLIGGLDAFYSQNRHRSTYGYDRDVIGGGPRLGWSYNDNLSHRLQFSARNERLINMRADLKANMAEGADSYNLFRLSQTLTYRDQVVDFVNDTRRGYTISLTNMYAGFGGDKYFIRNDLGLRQFFSFFEGSWQLGITGDFGKINSLEGTVLNSSNRYILGGDNLRGFEYGGTGARYARRDLSIYSLGGNWRANGTVQMNFPIGIPQKFGVKGYVFYDWGVLGPPDIANFNTLWHRGYFNYSDKVRMSHGVGILWASPIGEINLSWAWQDRYESFDQLQRFRFSIGNNF